MKATKSSEAGEMPSEALLTAMGQYNQDLVEAGVMVGGEGLKPSTDGKRVRFTASGKTVVDGPFEETTSLVSGYWIWEVASMDEAIEWAHR